MARTQTAILNRIAASTDPDEIEVLRGFLSYANAGSPPRPVGLTIAAYNAMVTALDPLQILRVQCEVAWHKITAHRLDRTNRNVERIRALIWMIADQAAIDAAQNAPPGKHGAGKLAAICNYFGFAIPSDPRIANMIAGTPCVPDCDRGCRP